MGRKRKASKHLLFNPFAFAFIFVTRVAGLSSLVLFTDDTRMKVAMLSCYHGRTYFSQLVCWARASWSSFRILPWQLLLLRGFPDRTIDFCHSFSYNSNLFLLFYIYFEIKHKTYFFPKGKSGMLSWTFEIRQRVAQTPLEWIHESMYSFVLNELQWIKFPHMTANLKLNGWMAGSMSFGLYPLWSQEQPASKRTVDMYSVHI